MAIVMIASLPLTAKGQWGTNVWPSWNYPRQGKAHAQHCYSGTVERATLRGNTPPNPPDYSVDHGGAAGTNYRGQWEIFRQYRQYWVTDSPDELTYYAITNKATGTDYEPYWSNEWSSIDDVVGIPYLTDTGVCDVIDCPSNFFWVTDVAAIYPWRNLCGLGVFGTTNDNFDGVGHPYGWTNAFTAAGGSFFPAGRSKWYTTDYNWNVMRGVVDQCLWTYDDSTNTWEADPGVTNWIEWESGAQTSWAVAVSELVIVDSGAGLDDPPQMYTWARQYDIVGSPRWEIKAKVVLSSPKVTGLQTNYEHDVDLYVQSAAAYYWDGSVVATFDANSQSVKDYVYPWASETIADTYASAVTGAVIGALSLPNLCDEPLTNGAKTAKGFICPRRYGVIRWDDGLNYK